MARLAVTHRRPTLNPPFRTYLHTSFTLPRILRATLSLRRCHTPAFGLIHQILVRIVLPSPYSGNVKLSHRSSCSNLLRAAEEHRPSPYLDRGLPGPSIRSPLHSPANSSYNSRQSEASTMTKRETSTWL